jgi:hypothetical protein
MPPPIDPASYESPRGQRPAVTPPIELERRAHDPYAAFRFGGFSLFTAGNLLSITSHQMLAIAVEWELYAHTIPRPLLVWSGWLSLCRWWHWPAAIWGSFDGNYLISQVFSALASAAGVPETSFHSSGYPVAGR